MHWVKLRKILIKFYFNFDESCDVALQDITSDTSKCSGSLLPTPVVWQTDRRFRLASR
jgi:hypothetical protein